LPTRWWYHGPRLALQPVLILAAVWAAWVIDWPFGRAGTGARSRETSR
jgi:hypothetical protein